MLTMITRKNILVTGQRGFPILCGSRTNQQNEKPKGRAPRDTPCRIKTSQHCAGNGQHRGADQEPPRCVEANAPSEALRIDHMDENEREHDADDESEHLAHQPEKARLQHDGAPHLSGIRTGDP